MWVGAATATVSPPSGSLAVALVTMALTAMLALVAPEPPAVTMACAWMAYVEVGSVIAIRALLGQPVNSVPQVPLDPSAKLATVPNMAVVMKVLGALAPASVMKAGLGHAVKCSWSRSLCVLHPVHPRPCAVWATAVSADWAMKGMAVCAQWQTCARRGMVAAVSMPAAVRWGQWSPVSACLTMRVMVGAAALETPAWMATVEVAVSMLTASTLVRTLGAVNAT